MGRRDKVRRNTKRKKKTKLATSADGTGWRLVLRHGKGEGRCRWQFAGPHEPDGDAKMVARRTATGWRIDKLPPGAILGDLSKQRCGMGGAHPAYLDYAYTCRRCGAQDVFTARAQQHWYETLGGYADSHAIHCRTCRDPPRHKRRVHRLLADALAAYDAAPCPKNALAIAEITLDAGDAVGERARQRGLGHAREALRAGLRAQALVGGLTRTP